MKKTDLKHTCAYSEADGRVMLEDPGSDYPEIIRDHAVNPRNFGEMSDGLADGYAMIVDPSCNDKVEVWILVEAGRVFDIRFKSDGCPGTIAANSMMTVLALGKTVKTAKQLTDEDVFSAFKGGLDYKRGCPLAGMQGLKQAIQSYEQKLNTA